MRSLQKYITLAIIVGLTSTTLAEPYSQGWESSNLNSPLQIADSGMSSYTLDWQDTAVPVAAPRTLAPVASAVEAPVIVNFAELPSLIRAAQPVQPAQALGGPSPADFAAARQSFNRGGHLRGPSRVDVPTHNITFRADRYFDVWTNNYRYVSRVEVLSFRGGVSPRT